MANLDLCISKGIFGTLTLSPSSFILRSRSNETQNIFITFIPSNEFFQSPQDVVAVIEFRDKDEQIIPNLNPIVSEENKKIYKYIELDSGRFQITIPSSRLQRVAGFSSIIFPFKFGIYSARPEYLCATVNVDAASSGFGFVYNYFKIESNLEVAEPEELDEELLPSPERGIQETGATPQEQIFIEKILSANSFYNFYIKNYEDYILFTDQDQVSENLNSEIINENLLPNINILSFLHSNNRNIQQNLTKEQSLNPGENLISGKFGDFSSINNFPLLNLASFGGIIDGEKSINFASNVKASDKFSVDSYFEELSEDVLNIYNNTEQGKQIIGTSYYQKPKNFLFNSQYEKIIYPKINNIKNIFPMYSHVFVDNELVTSAQANAVSFLNKGNISNYKKSIEKSRFFSDAKLRNKFNKYLDNIGLLDYFYFCLCSITCVTNSDISLASTSLDSISDFNYFFNIFLGYGTDLQQSRYRNTKDIFYVGDFDFIEQGAHSNNFDNVKLKNNLRDSSFIDEYLVDQVLCYRIDKWRIDDPNLATIKQIEEEEQTFASDVNLKPLQSYYFINNFEDTFLQFIDSQVKFQKEYEYRLYKYFTYVNSNNLSRNGAFKTVVIKKQFVESIKTFINDDPPVPPDLQIVPYKNNDKEFLFIISPSSGRYFDEPIAITEQDNEEIKKLLPFSLKNKENQIQYEGDDLITTYQLMRLETEPKKYSDFANAELFNINTPENGNVGFIETIEPNKKYYYIARSLDVHNKFSNPTAVFEVELINQSGTIYLRKKLIELNDVKYNFGKELDKFLEIKPASKHLVVNNTEEISAFDIKSLNMGPEKNAIWDKKFLLRLTSKTTGKKIDIRFKFDYRLQN